jgi:hypothetical protein
MKQKMMVLCVILADIICEKLVLEVQEDAEAIKIRGESSGANPEPLAPVRCAALRDDPTDQKCVIGLISAPKQLKPCRIRDHPPPFFLIS